MSGAATPGASAALARRLAPDQVGPGRERPVAVDQTNRSVVVDDTLIVKWFVPPVPDPHPGIAMIERLRTSGFVEMPRYFGAHAVDGVVVAMVSEFVTGARDGWDWYVDELVGSADGTVPAQRVIDSATAIGALGARLHVASATLGVVMIDVGDEASRWRLLLDEALDVVAGSAAEVLVQREQAIRSAFAAGDSDRTVPAIAVHGDFHVGQLLRAGDRLVITDFDGNPLLDESARHRPRPAVVDVASLVQSVDHAGRVAQKRRPDDAFRLEPLIAASTRAALDAYRSGLESADARWLLDEALLWPMQVAQELHELVYAVRHLPRWTYAPLATLRAMFPGQAHHTATRSG